MQEFPFHATAKEPVGFLSESFEVRKDFVVLVGPAILVARKGYGGRLPVIADHSFIVHEDGYAIRPKPAYTKMIDLAWFAGHYSAEFQSHRSSLEGIGDFPRAKLWSMEVTSPKLEWQRQCSQAYKKRDDILHFMKSAPQTLDMTADQLIAASTQSLKNSQAA